MGKKNDIFPGATFGHWTVLHRVTEGPATNVHVRWRCRCSCGKERDLNSDHIRKTKVPCLSCHIAKFSTTHGHCLDRSSSETYLSWAHMKSRCTDKNCKDYPNYGGRGITLCERWLSFENFLEDMGEKPKGYTIERDDVNKGYEKSNCRWIPKSEQSKNTRVTEWVVVGGERMCLADAVRKTGVCRSTVDWYRKRGKTTQDAFCIAQMIRREKTLPEE